MDQSREFVVDGQDDPVISGIIRLAEKFGFNPPLGLFNFLPRSADGTLPFHQAGSAIDLVGLNWERHEQRRLPRRAEFYPALIRTADGGAVAALEFAENDLLVVSPGEAEARWCPIAEIEAGYGGELVTVVGNPDKLREQEAPWHAKGRGHWFW